MESGLRKLNESGNSVYVTSPKEFKEDGTINQYSLDSLKWAYDNAYNGHFKNARNAFSTMRDAFLGKLGEFACYEWWKSKGYKLDPPELILRKRGEWDDGDLVVEERKVQVKTTGYNSNFMLLRKKDWDENANYLWGKNGKDDKYGAFFLCRIKPDPRKIFQEESRLMDLISICENTSWKYEITGWLPKKHIAFAIANNFIIPRGRFLNGKVRIEEDLIYFQAGDLKSPDLIPRKKENDAE